MSNFTGFSGSSRFPSRAASTRLSPTAAEFHASGPLTPNSWARQVCRRPYQRDTKELTAWKTPVEAAPTYVPPSEPMNYRRLLDRNMSCNWKYIVDKIVCSNDQQASLFLQQKLKGATADQKYEIIEAIIEKAYALMVNRFGNFLIQRCFEHGTHAQIIAIANAIVGNTVKLSMDSFGCHVVQRAFDAVPEEYKAKMVHELLRHIPETVTHRYACHVWQKLFELRWSESPPQIMRRVNEALQGMWHEVALGETGSLVVQNIFENCLEEDKRPCIREVLASIDVIAHGQFGNWCIQHICEHGAPADRSQAIDHILRNAVGYSMDQYASKVIEKCLKIGGNDFLERYLDRICEGHPARPRIPLIDISADQYGNYLIQYILQHAGPQHRDLVATHVRKHMVSLRGSKYGSRVAQLCTNPMSVIRPGPGMHGLPMARVHHHHAPHSNNAHHAAPHHVTNRSGAYGAVPPSWR
ncbi:armadillo-type protein [Lineolata rhizophorae]|uniref:Armadillo-type protein n=1 Tax=Lineolata rhizophorae TaxID=578093 RepID=A0A6A6PEH0_9PEZI|nr:armadillo-type protein [Lineolata rhizophorae]